MAELVESIPEAEFGVQQQQHPSVRLDNQSPNNNYRRFPNVARYVQTLGGTRTITKVLIANNGVAAVKAIRSIRRWAYDVFGDERAIQFVVMATPEDLRYVRVVVECVWFGLSCCDEWIHELSNLTLQRSLVVAHITI